MRAALGLVGVVALGTGVGACSREPPALASERAAPAVRADPAPPVREKRPPPRPARLTQVTIKALGMTCEESCPLKVRHALADITQVYELGFDLSTESIFVSFDASLGPAKQVTAPMLAAIKQTGFDPWLARESWPADAPVQVIAR